MNTDNVIKEGFPYEITLAGCYVCIKAGLAGTFKIHQHTIAVDGCSDNLSVLCDGSDKKDYITILDLSKSRTGFNPKIISLYPEDFGFESGSELVAYIAGIAGRPVALKCCYEDRNELAISNKLIFCNSEGLEVEQPLVSRLICFSLRYKDDLPLDTATVRSLFPIKYNVNGVHFLSIEEADVSNSTDKLVLLEEIHEIVRTFYESIPGVVSVSNKQGTPVVGPPVRGFHEIKIELLQLGIFDVKYSNATGVNENIQIGYSPDQNSMFVIEYDSGALDYASAGMLHNCDLSSVYQTGEHPIEDFLV